MNISDIEIRGKAPYNFLVLTSKDPKKSLGSFLDWGSSLNEIRRFFFNFNFGEWQFYIQDLIMMKIERGGGMLAEITPFSVHPVSDFGLIQFHVLRRVKIT